MRLRPWCFLPICLAAVLGPAGCGGDNTTLPAETDESLYREAQQFEREGQTQRALSDYLKLIAKRGDQAPESHLEAGVIELEDVKNPIDAIYHFQKYLELDPNSKRGPLVRDQIERAKRDFAATLPAPHFENFAISGAADEEIAQLRAENQALREQLRALGAGVSPPLHPAANTDLSAPPPMLAQASQMIPITPTASTAPAPGPTRPAASGRTHVVAPHDTLYSLSVHYYGTGSKWRDILAANRDQLSGEHQTLSPGMVLKIP